MGVEAEEAQQAQHVLFDPFARIADESHHPVPQIGQAVAGIVDIAVLGAGQRIDGEIAPLRVGPPIVGKDDPGMATVGLHVATQRGDLERLALG